MFKYDLSEKHFDLSTYPQQSPHRWEICSMCGPMVMCGYCNNNCCNGGTRGSYDPEHPCPDKCKEAYALQDKGCEMHSEELKKFFENHTFEEVPDDYYDKLEERKERIQDILDFGI